MLILSQLDKLWAKIKIGKTNRTVAQIGCTTTDISMSSSFFGEYRNPGDLAQKLEYTVDGYVLWKSIGMVFKTIEFEWREWKYNRDMIDAALKHPDKTCLLQVDRGAHWVLGIRRLYRNTYWVADPYGGKRKIYSGVVGHATLRRKR